MMGFLNWLKARLTHSADLPLVLIFGAIGGLLAPAIQALPDQVGGLAAFDLPHITFRQARWFAILGAFAAGVSVYVAANSRLEDLKRLAFFALLCGAAFPAIFLNSVDQISKQAERQVALGKDIASDPTKSPDVRAAAAAAVTTGALKDAPAAKVDPETRASITADTKDTITALQNEKTPEASAAANSILQAAKAYGYIEVKPKS